jgi:uncharacterized glyoxalase superfamily protein PhnB
MHASAVQNLERKWLATEIVKGGARVRPNRSIPVVAMDRSRETSDAPVSSDHGVLVRVPDVDAHFARAAAAGAEIVSPPQTYPFGERQYSARDVGGHRWTFSETVEDVDPAMWGGTLE